MRNLLTHLTLLVNMNESKRLDYIELLKIKNYGSNELTETELWMLENTIKDSNYLELKLKEAEALATDEEAPEEETTDNSMEDAFKDAIDTESGNPSNMDDSSSMDTMGTENNDETSSMDNEMGTDSTDGESNMDTMDTENNDEPSPMDNEMNTDSSDNMEDAFKDAVDSETNDDLAMDDSDSTSTDTIDNDIDNEVDTDTGIDSEESSKIETSAEGVGILPLISEIQDKLANGKPSEVELAALKALKKLVK